ncbi:hypothetical protein Y1Q_0001742 [Alligator mississippiensis]|uniref:Uncharacterized protein n=1 Tax=Alligator mississippiensis TaxID=8496 RepID=A0A151P5J5_ALLMI|nr:hypothetical protein Y1Q_0001742 [Alligator mississippiensis]
MMCRVQRGDLIVCWRMEAQEDAGGKHNTALTRKKARVSSRACCIQGRPVQPRGLFVQGDNEISERDVVLNGTVEMWHLEKFPGSCYTLVSWSNEPSSPLNFRKHILVVHKKIWFLANAPSHPLGLTTKAMLEPVI